MHKLIIKYNKQLKMLNLRDGKTYTISEDERADITLKSLGEVIHLDKIIKVLGKRIILLLIRCLLEKVTLMTLHYSLYRS